jgi:hypothetical protein
MFIDALKGLILEEALGFVLKSSGYRVIHTVPRGDTSLTGSGLTLRVKGRGANHQADVLGDLHATPAFCSPLRLFVEAKWQSSPLAKVRIPVVRAAMGVLSDVNQFWRPTAKKRNKPRVAVSRYDYRFVIFSRFGFSAKAIDLAAVHHIHLVDLSSRIYQGLVDAVDRLGNAILALDPATGRDRPQTRLKASGVRRMLRDTLFPGNAAYASQDPAMHASLGPHLATFRAALAAGSQFFIATTSTGHVVMMATPNSAPLLDVLNRSPEPTAQIHFDERDPALWHMTFGQERYGASPESLDFSLPQEMLPSLLAQGSAIELRQKALGFKEDHFSEFWIFAAPMEEMAPLLRRIRIDKAWLNEAKRKLVLDRRRRERRP